MALVLTQVRPCDGACCREAPRWPNVANTDCIYRDPTKPERGCKIQSGEEPIPSTCTALFEITAEETYQTTCLDWPFNTIGRIGETGGCCWQWVDDAD